MVGDVGFFSFRNSTAAALPARSVTLGQVFAAGLVPSGARLQARIAQAAAVPVQMDVKTTHSDGTVKYAVLTVGQPEVPAGATLLVTLQGTAEANTASLELTQIPGYSCAIHLELQGAEAVDIDVADALSRAVADGSASWWLKGPMAAQARVELPARGALRLVVDVSRYADGATVTDVQFANDVAMEETGGVARYDATVTLNGTETIFAGLEHVQYAQWRHVFDSVSTPAAFVVNDMPRWIAAQAILPYDLALGVNDSLLTGYAASALDPSWNAPFSSRGITRYMPTTGGRGDIGSTTQANAAWVISQDERAARYALGQAEAAAHIPWHYYDRVHSHWLSLDDYPALWTDGRGGPPPNGLTQPSEDRGGWDPDTAHQPELAFHSYLFTGSRFFLDQLNAQATFNLMSSWPVPREEGRGLLVKQNQVRGAAWGLRQLDLAAYANPDGSYEKQYFARVLAENFAWMNEHAGEWATTYGEIHGFLPGDYGTEGNMAPWQQDYLVSAVVGAVRHGSTGAKTFLDWSSNFLLGRFQNGASGFSPNDGVAYNLRYLQDDGAPITTWSSLGAAMRVAELSNGTGWAHSQGDYAQLGAMSLALIHSATAKPEAAALYRWLRGADAPFLGDLDVRNNPALSIAPPP